MVHQLCTANAQLVRYSMDEYRSKGTIFVTEFDTLRKIFTTMIGDSSCGDVICILDGLDECGQQSRDLFIDSLVGYFCRQLNPSRMKERGRVKFLLTSRPYPEIVRRFHQLHSMHEIRLKGENESTAIAEDIEHIVKIRIEALGLLNNLSEVEQLSLQERIVSNADKTFLWVSLVLQLIESSARVSPKVFDEIIHTIPDSLDAMYSKILEASPDKEFARKILHIVLAAPRPLSLQELNSALHIEEKHKSYDDLVHDLDRSIESTAQQICSPFIKIHDSYVDLIHLTAKEFLLKPPSVDKFIPNVWKHSFEGAYSNQVLARSCVWYLRLCRVDCDEYASRITSMDIGRSDTDKSDSNVNIIDSLPNGDGATDQIKNLNKLSYNDWENVRKWLIQNREFYKYSDDFWKYHYDASNVTSEDPLFTATLLLCTESRLQSKWPKIQEPGVLVAASFDLVPVLELLRRNGENMGIKGKRGETALHIAAEFKNERSVRFLIEDPTLIDVENDLGSTPLFYAENSIARLLLHKGAFANHTNDYGETPLCRAVRRRDKTKVRLLLTCGAIVNMRGRFGKTSLLNAVELLSHCKTHDNSHYPIDHDKVRSLDIIIENLVMSGADFMIPGDYGVTARDFLMDLMAEIHSLYFSYGEF